MEIMAQLVSFHSLWLPQATDHSVVGTQLPHPFPCWESLFLLILGGTETQQIKATRQGR